MTNAPGAAILGAFYGRMGLVAIVYGLVVLAVVVGANRRRGEFFSRLAWPTTRYDAVRIGLGLLWIVDGLLQAQPDMSSQLLSNIVVPLFSTLPTLLVRGFEPLVVLLSEHPLTFDLVIMWTQITLGLAILFASPGRLRRLTLQATILWGLGVWVVGEGMGGIFGTGATWLTGSPGSVLFYMAAAVFLLQGEHRWRDHTVAREVRWLFACLWLFAALIQAWPTNGFWTAAGLQAPVVSMAQMPQPHALLALLYGSAHLLAANPVFWNGAMVGVMLLLALGYVFFPDRPAVLYATLVWLLLTWVLGQDFGVMGGLGTDPNSSPAVALLLVALRPDRSAQSAAAPGGAG